MTERYRPVMERTLSREAVHGLSDKRHPAEDHRESSSQVRPPCTRCGRDLDAHTWGVWCP